jgi:transposase
MELTESLKSWLLCATLLLASSIVLVNLLLLLLAADLLLILGQLWLLLASLRELNDPGFELLFLPTYCPRANPIERAFGDVHDKCTRNHKRSFLSDLIVDVKIHLRHNGPWPYSLSSIYYEAEVSAELIKLSQHHLSMVA